MHNMEIDDDQLTAAAQLADLAYQYGQVPCEHDPDTWFPEKSNDRLPGYYGLHGSAAMAKELCINECPIVLHCRAYALKHHEIEGIWGGMSYLDRKVVWSKEFQEQGPKSRKGIPNKRR